MVFRKLSLLLFACIVLITAAAIPSYADPIHYSFSTTGGVGGGFTLNDSTPFNFQTGEYGDCCGHLGAWVFATSEFMPITGAFGAYSFTGTAQLRVRDNLSPYEAAMDLGQEDFWYLTSFTSGAPVNGRSLTFLGLYENLLPQTDMSSLYTPPPSTRPSGYYQDPDDFFYIANFSDGTNEFGYLGTLSQVPEPASLLLLGLGLAGVITVKFRQPRT